MKQLERWDVWFYCADEWKFYAQEISEDRLIKARVELSPLNATMAVKDIGSRASGESPLLFQRHCTWSN